MTRPVQARRLPPPLVVVVALFAAAAAVGAEGECSASSPCADASSCCSQYGYCGTGDAYCGTHCVAGPCTGSDSGTGDNPPPPSSGSNPPPPSSGGGGSGWSSFFSESVFNSWFPSPNSVYSFQAFSEAASSYSSFGNSGSSDDQKREIAAFFGNVQLETGGLQYVDEIPKNPPSIYCQSDDPKYPCATGKSYHGRGALQISWNYNYGACGDALGLNLLDDPDQVAQNGGTAFKTALWFWMTSGCHEDILQNSFAGTNLLINGMECAGKDPDHVESRVKAYQQFCGTFQVDTGSDLRC